MRTLLAAALMLSFGMANAQTVDNTVNTNANAGAVADSSSESQAGASSDNLNVVNPNQSVGVGFTQTFEASKIPATTTARLKGNTAVPLAAAVSFSSDYCGGTASGGASAAGISLGLGAPKMDGNCQALRRAEKFGTAAANAYNAGMKDLAAKLITAQVWEICSSGDWAKHSATAANCEKLGLMQEASIPVAEPAAAQPPSQPQPIQYSQPRQPRGEAAAPSDDSTKQASQRAIIRGSDGRTGEYEEYKKVGR